MNTHLVIKSLAEIPPEVVSSRAAPVGSSELNSRLINARHDVPSPVLLRPAGSEPVSPGVDENRKARILELQPWTHGGLNE
jgi:hypothetical protein